jgi:uncharacterized membrane protein (DUF4010 family)
LLGGLSGLSGWIWTQQTEALAVVLLAGAVAIVVSAYIAASRREVDATTEVAAIVVLAAGMAAGLGNWGISGGVIAVTTLLLVEKSRIHDIARRLDDTSLRAAVRFGVMAIVILPLLPEGPFGPWGGVRPRTLWLAVLIFSGLSFAGYIARNALRSSSGYIVAGIFGGLISSTSVAFSFSRLSRFEPKQSVSLALGVIGASTLLFPRVAVSTFLLNPELARDLIPYLWLPLVAGTVVTAVGWRLDNKSVEPKAQVKNPLQFWTSLQMAAVFQGVLYMVYWLGRKWGSQGLIVSGMVLGLTDVDALTISMARGGHGATPEVAALALSLGILSNTALKAAVTLIFGTGRFRWIATGALALIACALALSLFLFR